MRNDIVRKGLAVCMVITLAVSSAFAANVLDGKGIRIEFNSQENGFGCLSIDSKVGGKHVRFGYLSDFTLSSHTRSRSLRHTHHEVTRLDCRYTIWQEYPCR